MMQFLSNSNVFSWLRAVVLGFGALAISAMISLAGFQLWKHACWQKEMIARDFGTIERLCGGDTEEEPLLDIQFIKEWEYKALKKTKGGEPVWLHLELSKRRCGNWMLMDPSESKMIRALGIGTEPPKLGVDCVGNPMWR